jgi:mRNA-degrading endonuclease RelE of RelBE toxin-antitoxin system
LTCKLEFERPAQKELTGLPETVSKRIQERLLEIAQNPSCDETLRGKLSNLCKTRVGDYRIIYYPAQCTIIIIRIGKRENIYEKL